MISQLLIYLELACVRDIQALAGHASLSTTQRYIEADVEAQRRIVDLL